MEYFDRIDDLAGWFNKGAVDKLKSKAFYNIVADIVESSIQQNFEVQGRFSGKGENATGGTTTWSPLASSTIKARTRKGYYPGKMLQVTGALKSSISYEATNEGVSIGVGMEYGKYLQQGTSKMDARPFLVIQEDDLEEIGQEAIRFLMKAL